MSSPSLVPLVPLPRWPRPMIESRGDYASPEEYEIELIVGNGNGNGGGVGSAAAAAPLYSNPPSIDLPRLPVPNLSDTRRRLIPTCLPLSTSESETASFMKAAEEFFSPSSSSGVTATAGETLQRRLLERKDAEDGRGTSWLQTWWNSGGYLDVRDPVTVNVSYFFHLKDDVTLPVVDTSAAAAAAAAAADDGGGAIITPGVRRGAAMLHAACEYRRGVCSGSIKRETAGPPGPRSKPLCSAMFRYMFNACRVPRAKSDTYRIYDPSRHDHVVVIRSGRFYSVRVMEEGGEGGGTAGTTATTGRPLPLSVIEERLGRVVRMARDADAEEEEDAVTGHESAARRGTKMELGWLTSWDRDSWAEAREEILISMSS